MRQSRRESLVESTLGTAAGMLLSWTVNVYVVPPLLGLNVSGAQSAGLVAIFSVLSVLRQYALRRLFNARRR